MKRVYNLGGALAVAGALMLGPCAPAPSPPSTPKITGVTATKAITLANQQRVKAGLPKLKTGTALHAAAKQHSVDQAQRNKLTHVGSDGSDAGDRITRNGGTWRRWAENVASGYRSASAVIKGWMNSPGHRRNLLDPKMTRMSIGRATAKDGTWYWTMVLKG